jgi:hypothetical protein
VMRSLNGSAWIVGLILLATFAQIARNWLVLHAVGVDVSVFDATAVLIAQVTLAQLPLGPTTGAASTVLILGPHGVAAVAAAGVLLTVTGTIGGGLFALWALFDRLRYGSLAPEDPLDVVVREHPLGVEPVADRKEPVPVRVERREVPG